MTADEQDGTGKRGRLSKRVRLALEILGVLFVVVQSGIYWRQANIYEAQLNEMRDGNVKTQWALDAAEQARKDDSAQHARERKEDQDRLDRLDKIATDANQRANDANQRLNDLQRKTDEVRFQLTAITARFVSGFDNAVTTAYKMTSDKTNLGQLKELGQGIIAQRKSVRDTTAVVQGNMTIIYDAVDSLIDELDRELSAPIPNSARIRDLLRLIYEAKGGTENRVMHAAEVSLTALGCNGVALASALSN